MRYKVFGERTGLKVSEFALGTGLLGNAYGYGTEPDEGQKILEGYAEAGGNLFDLSDAYQRGDSERLIGKFVGDHRNDFVLVSKYTCRDAVEVVRMLQPGPRRSDQGQDDGEIAAREVR